MYPTRLAVAPWALAYANATDRAFATYDAGMLRALNPATEYASAFSAAPGANVRLTADTTLAASTSVNTLTLNGHTLTLDGGNLTLAGGGLMFNPTASNNGRIVGTGSLVLPEEGIVHVFRARSPLTPPESTLTVDVPLSGGML